MATATASSTQTYDVGGVLLPRPFKIRRFGHVGLNLDDPVKCLPFYCDLLGFMVAEQLELHGRFKTNDEAAKFPFTKGLFIRHGTDHHSFVIFPKFVLNALAGYPPIKPSTVLNQLAWQVGSIREVTDAITWLQQAEVELLRIGRDQPGGNWHVYSFDPDRYINEMFYGIEQIGWDRLSKPLAVYDAQMDAPVLPIIPEYQEVADAIDRGVDASSGYRHEPMGKPTYEVDGVLLPRPFKIIRTGPIRLFVSNMDASLRYYTALLGFRVTEEVAWKGHRCVFLRVNTEHHSLALYPEDMRRALQIDNDKPYLSIGIQVATYTQLRAAVEFLRTRGVTIRGLPGEVSAGIDYSALALDPEGNAIELYYYMEQVGWDGRPRERRTTEAQGIAEWPKAVPAREDTYSGEVFLGPWS
jgi:catechol 2,3-dioxygenase-like lactoylglutathione lyase family enzyme